MIHQPTSIVFATNNAHKLEEVRAIAGDKFSILSLGDIDCHDEIPETADTLEGNALIKARWIFDKYGIGCFADDTGLLVDALGGAPGVRSARYAGEECDPDANINKLLTELGNSNDRSARFETVIAYIDASGCEHCFTGRVDGMIDTKRTGTGGFGYDPVFVPIETGISFACMSSDDKNRISHRGRAMQKLFDYLLNR